MKIIHTDGGAGLFGPFAQVEVLEDRLRCDGADLPFTVIGEYGVLDDPELPDGFFAHEYEFTGGEFVRKPAPAPTDAELALLVSGFVRKVDADVDAIYIGAIGARGIEYTDAAVAAEAYKAAGYAGTVPDDVDSWAAAAQQSAQWAADDILAARDRLEPAKKLIRRKRLKVKEDARRAVDLAGVEAAQAEWAAFVVAIRAQLGLPA